MRVRVPPPAQTNSMQLPPELMRTVQALQDRSRQEIVREVYDVVSRHFVCSRPQTYLRLWDLFRSDLTNVWQRGGFCHCTQQNELIRQMLLKTGKFSEKQVRTKWGLTHYISPHQWLQVNLDGNWVDVDAWGRHFDVPFGKNAAGFTASWRKQWRE